MGAGCVSAWKDKQERKQKQDASLELVPELKTRWRRKPTTTGYSGAFLAEKGEVSRGGWEADDRLATSVVSAFPQFGGKACGKTRISQSRSTAVTAFVTFCTSDVQLFKTGWRFLCGTSSSQGSGSRRVVAGHPNARCILTARPYSSRPPDGAGDPRAVERASGGRRRKTGRGRGAPEGGG